MKATASKKASGTKKPRVRAVPRHRTLRLTKRQLKQVEPVPGAIALLKQTVRIIRSNKRLFIGLAVVNMVLSYVFIQGLGSSFDINGLKANFEDLLGSSATGKVTTGVALFSYLVGSAGTSASESAGVYQLVLTLITSLAVIWIVRQVMANEKPQLRDGFYKGMYPLVPFILVLIVIILQLIPLLLGNLVFSTVIQNGLAVTAIEKFLWFLIYILLAVLTLYMITSSVFALYIVTLPDVRPVQALRSARELVLHRRVTIALRIVALPLMLIVAGLLLFVPLLIFATVITQPLFLLMTSLSLVVFHIYMYVLYRALI